MKPSHKENKLLSDKLKRETELMEKELMLVEKLVTGNNINLKSLLKTGINSKNTKKLIENIDKIDINEYVVKKENPPLNTINSKSTLNNEPKISNKNLNKIDESKLNKANSKGKVIKSAKFTEKNDINLNINSNTKLTKEHNKIKLSNNIELRKEDITHTKSNSITNQSSTTEENEVFLLSNINMNNNNYGKDDINNNLTEKEKDQLYWNQLSNKKKSEYKFKYREVYDFLNEINLSRYIEIFLEEGFNTLELVLMITEEFLLKKSFKDHQIKKFINQINNKIFQNNTSHVNEIDNSKINRNNDGPKNVETHEFSINTDDTLFNSSSKNVSICWNCLKSCKEESHKIVDEKSFYPNKVVIIIIIFRFFAQINVKNYLQMKKI